MTGKEIYHIGDTVIHPGLGQGVVIPAQEEEGFITVRFEGEAGVRHLSLQHAKLQIVPSKKKPRELYPETPFAKEVREYVEGLHGHILELSKPIIDDEHIVGYFCKVHLWMQTSYEKGQREMIKQVSYAPNYTSFVCIEQVKAFIDESTRLEFNFYLKTVKFEKSEGTPTTPTKANFTASETS